MASLRRRSEESMSLKVFEGDPISVHTVRLLLQANGITVSVLGEDLFAAGGEFPVPLPSVWVRNEDYERAAALIAAKDTKTRESWICSSCGEVVEDQFGECWKCGRERAYATERI
jgi:hypothetical protein